MPFILALSECDNHLPVTSIPSFPRWYAQTQPFRVHIPPPRGLHFKYLKKYHLLPWPQTFPAKHHRTFKGCWESTGPEEALKGLLPPLRDSFPRGSKREPSPPLSHHPGPPISLRSWSLGSDFTPSWHFSLRDLWTSPLLRPTTQLPVCHLSPPTCV
jgi:hypothetical protein